MIGWKSFSVVKYMTQRIIQRFNSNFPKMFSLNAIPSDVISVRHLDSAKARANGEICSEVRGILYTF